MTIWIFSMIDTPVLVPLWISKFHNHSNSTVHSSREFNLTVNKFNTKSFLWGILKDVTRKQDARHGQKSDQIVYTVINRSFNKQCILQWDHRNSVLCAGDLLLFYNLNCKFIDSKLYYSISKDSMIYIIHRFVSDELVPKGTRKF
jgi:hypothetical protein